MNNWLQGERRSFPLSLDVIVGLHRQEMIFETLDDLIRFISNEMEKPTNSKKNIKQILEEIGLVDTITLLDERTADFLDKYFYYKSPATAKKDINNSFWYEAIVTLETFLEGVKWQKV